MPILSKPNSIVETTLACEKDKPEADRILWRVRVLSASDAQVYRDRIDAVDALRDEAAQNAAINSIILEITDGWSNVVDSDSSPVTLDATALDFFSYAQKYMFAVQLPGAAGWSAALAKK